ncbi:MAG: hypothetical protein J7545_09810, partial [Roseofilum sp. SBFL]|uniref:hypothetical protein n=1 Tax=Roseofilum sp. SBFL TaxID=2821496 RepID=UPI001B172BAB
SWSCGKQQLYYRSAPPGFGTSTLASYRFAIATHSRSTVLSRFGEGIVQETGFLATDNCYSGLI